MSNGQEFQDISITYDQATKKTTVTPDPAPIFWKTGPASAQWDAFTMPDGAKTFDIRFDNGNSPFRVLERDPNSTTARMLGTDNTRISGQYKYAVVFLDASGREVDRLDPIIDNQDEPHGGP